MSKEKVREQFNGFRELLGYNFEAVQHLSNIRLGLESDRNYNAEGSFYNCVDAARHMLEVYADLAKLSSSERESYNAKLAEVEQKGSLAVTRLRLSRKMGYDGSSVLQEASSNLFEKVENLSKEIADPQNKKFDIEKVTTIHDMVRYLHQKALDRMFSLDDKDEDSSQDYNFGNLYFKLKDIGQGLKTANKQVKRKDVNCAPLELIIDEYETLSDKPSALINAIIDKDYLNAHFALGCHSADLSTLVNDRDCFVDLQYNESKGFKNSDRRSEYLRACFEHLGFKVTRRGSQLKAGYRNGDLKSTSEALKGAARALLTCKDLDLNGGLDRDEDVNFAIGYFRAGGSSPRKILRVRQIVDAVLEAKLGFNKTLAQLEHSVKPKIGKEKQKVVNYLELYLIDRLNAIFPGHKELDTTINQILTGEFLTPRPEDLIGANSDSVAVGKFDKFENIISFYLGAAKETDSKKIIPSKEDKLILPDYKEFDNYKMFDYFPTSFIKKIPKINKLENLKKITEYYVPCFCKSGKPYKKCHGLKP